MISMAALRPSMVVKSASEGGVIKYGPNITNPILTRPPTTQPTIIDNIFLKIFIGLGFNSLDKYIRF
jgi:hypothetical protein